MQDPATITTTTLIHQTKNAVIASVNIYNRELALSETSQDPFSFTCIVLIGLCFTSWLFMDHKSPGMTALFMVSLIMTMLVLPIALYRPDPGPRIIYYFPKGAGVYGRFYGGKIIPMEPLLKQDSILLQDAASRAILKNQLHIDELAINVIDTLRCLDIERQLKRCNYTCL